MAKAVANMSDEELDAEAIDLKNEEQEFLTKHRARKVEVRDEIQRRADRSYASQRLTAVGVTVTPERLNAIMETH